MDVCVINNNQCCRARPVWLRLFHPLDHAANRSNYVTYSVHSDPAILCRGVLQTNQNQVGFDGLHQSKVIWHRGSSTSTVQVYRT